MGQVSHFICFNKYIYYKYNHPSFSLPHIHSKPPRPPTSCINFSSQTSNSNSLLTPIIYRACLAKLFEPTY
ncbi:hypothetical protein HanXRQr2_Chr08g0361201 [Helianthus annuus]|uniref:Uncharacterized protein n=1 Tax=Helianthus annuus TaxID=4232 RepID=A0A251UA88_HELAN|nr:hypothetical protein HanXRQr2_Chr08g0361201 [Helianthus annuus]KAJ0548975.1 hypothetical protein HanIR_Chr08g0389881 [Helianthus annuus]KAJ0903389.1 hypothetical protein HanPSC8_Chr08g0348491 [Helianthus annuus]